MNFPKLCRVRQHFPRTKVDDIATAVRLALDKLDLSRDIRSGQTVALTAGSRGIANIPLVLKATADFLKKFGAKPFLVPTMGSHGGGTSEGQRHILESYGITEEAVGVPIRASMEVVTVGSTAEGYPVYLDRLAAQADHIGVVARIKPHTGYHGPIESGLLKMMMIGLGKHVGALAYHRVLLDEPYDKVVRSTTRLLRAKAPIRFGLALVENAYEDTALIEGVAPDAFESREEQLLVQAKQWLARLPVRSADLLIVDEIGKNVSGSGMDTNVVGRKRAFRGDTSAVDQPSYRHIFVRGLTDKTHGNASGIGLADFTTTRLVKAMNYRATVINCLTAGYPEGAFTPVHFETDREVIEAALKIIGRRDPEESRVLRIRNTLLLEEIEATEACLAEATGEVKLTVGEARPMTFDAQGNLPPWSHG